MKIAVIGAGAMGGSLATGLLKGGRVAAGDMTVADPTAAALEPFAAAGAHTTTDNVAAVQGAAVVFVVVKPWIVERVVRQVRPAMDCGRQTLVVIAAGVSSADILTWAADSQGNAPSVLLAIPNIAVAELCSMTFVVPVRANEAQTASVSALFDSVGRTLITEDYAVNPNAKGYRFIPGLYNDAQLEGNRKLTETIHRYDSKIFCQIYHPGRQSTHFVNGGVQPIAPSATMDPCFRRCRGK